MSYVVCRSCKNFVKVDENLPLNFDKCENCGHLLEFAGNDKDLNIILNDIKVPELSYNKICMSCHSLNPRETGSCLYCGSQNLHFQYDIDSFRDFQKENDISGDIDLNNGVNTIILHVNPKFSPKYSVIFRLLSLIIGLIDFFFFVMLGIDLILGVSEVPADIMLFVTQNLLQLSLIISISLILAGLLSVMIIPKMSYLDSLKTSSSIGVIVGLITLLVSKNLLTIFVSVVFCTILTSIGGLIGEYIIHKFVK